MKTPKQLALPGLRDIPEGHKVEFRAWITLKNGVRLYAKAYGLKAFPVLVRS